MDSNLSGNLFRCLTCDEVWVERNKTLLEGEFPCPYCLSMEIVMFGGISNV